MISTNVHDLLSGRTKIPFSEREIPDTDGFPMIRIVVDVPLEVVLDDGQSIVFDEGALLDDISVRSALGNDRVIVGSINELKTLDPTHTVSTTLKALEGEGMFEGFEEWWFITRKIGKETLSVLRFNLVIGLPESAPISLPPGTLWTDCLTLIEKAINHEDRPNRTALGYETVCCDRLVSVSGVQVISEDLVPQDLLDFSKKIFFEDDDE